MEIMGEMVGLKFVVLQTVFSAQCCNELVCLQICVVNSNVMKSKCNQLNMPRVLQKFIKQAKLPQYSSVHSGAPRVAS